MENDVRRRRGKRRKGGERMISEGKRREEEMVFTVMRNGKGKSERMIKEWDRGD